MAGIIAQLTRAARIRRDRRTYSTSKCMYSLEPFRPHGFDPMLDNKFMLRRQKMVLMAKEEEMEIARISNLMQVQCNL